MKKCLFLLCILFFSCSTDEIDTETGLDVDSGINTDDGSDTDDTDEGGDTEEVVLSFKESKVETKVDLYNRKDNESITNINVEVGLTSFKDKATVQVEVDKELPFDGGIKILPDACYSISPDVQITSKDFVGVPIKFVVKELKKYNTGQKFYLPLRVKSSDENVILSEDKSTCIVVMTIDKSEWTLVWSDEFNYVGKPDPKKWVYEKGFVRNKELQYYTDKNASVNGKCLVIQGRKERFKNPNYDPKATGPHSWKKTRQYVEYTSSSLSTFGAATGWKSWLYGRFEIRAKLPNVWKLNSASGDKYPKGPFPAIWTVGMQGWPKSGEIDLLEYAFRSPQDLHDGPCIHTNMVYAKNGNGGDLWKAKSRRITYFRDGTVGSSGDRWPKVDRGWMDKFHVWRLDWTKDYIRVFIDDVKYFECNLNTLPASEVGAFRKYKHALILNLAIGNKGGEPVNVWFPLNYMIDYVRIYKHK